MVRSAWAETEGGFVMQEKQGQGTGSDMDKDMDKDKKGQDQTGKQGGPGGQSDIGKPGQGSTPGATDR
jgi:hypothetical protein